MFKAPLVFNDLSWIEADSVETARHWFTETLSAVAQLIHQQVCVPVLHARQDFHEILLSDDYGFDEWLNELDYQDELRLLAQQLTTQTPAHAHLVATANEDFCRCEFRLKTSPEKACDALGVALISDGISISFPSQGIWNETFIVIEQVLYDNELNPEKVLQHRVRSVSQVIHVEPVMRDWRRSIGEHSCHAADLLDRWKVAFPYLDLCCEYQNKFLPNLRGRTFQSVLKRLRELDDSCHTWTINEQSEVVYPMYTRPEHSETMKNSRLAKMREATCPHNGKQYFTMHCNLQPKGYRLYWFVDTERRHLTIGYVGPHLETIRHKAQ